MKSIVSYAEQSTNRSTFASLLFVLALTLLCSLASAEAAWAEGEEVSGDPYADAAAVELENGEYTIDVVLEGGSGRATIKSPAKLTVIDGAGVAAIEWSSANYDYMLVAGKKYLPVNAAGNSIFMIPVLAYDEPFDVVGDTTAMSEPHEIDYTLTFNAASIAPFDSAASGASDKAAENASAEGAQGETSADSSATGASSAANESTSNNSGGIPIVPIIVGIVVGSGVAVLMLLRARRA